MIVAFDDYFFVGHLLRSPERRAMLELLARHTRWALVPFFFPVRLARQFICR